jgi:hypothetical protein
MVLFTMQDATVLNTRDFEVGQIRKTVPPQAENLCIFLNN